MLDSIKIAIAAAEQRIEELKPLAPQLREEHLRNCRQVAQEADKSEVIKEITCMLREEMNQKIWRKARLTSGKP